MISGLKTTVGRNSHRRIIHRLGRRYRTHRAVLDGIGIGSLYGCCIANYHHCVILFALEVEFAKCQQIVCDNGRECGF